MKKYFAVLKIGWQDALEYRTEFFISFFGWLVRLLISVFLFVAVFQERNNIGGFDLKETILYFIVIQILMTLVFSRVGFQIGNEIQKGDLSNYLVKPISYLLFQYIRQFSRNIMQVMFGLMLFLLLFLVVDANFFSRINLSQVSLSVFSTIFSYIINISLVSIIGLSAFWVTNSSRLIFMFYAILSVLSGLMIPINFFPENIQTILFNTPFPYIFYVPAQLFLGHITFNEYLVMLPKSIFFVSILIIIMLLVYKIGLKKYEAVGK